MQLALLIIGVLTLSGQSMSWSLNELIAGDWVVESMEAWDNTLKFMDWLEMSEEAIEAAKAGKNPDSSNIVINVLDETEGARSIEWIPNASIAKTDKLIMKEKEPFSGVLANGKEYSGTVEFTSAEELVVKSETKDKEIACTNVYKFAKGGFMQANYYCSRMLMKEEFRMVIPYTKRENRKA